MENFKLIFIKKTGILLLLLLLLMSCNDNPGGENTDPRIQNPELNEVPETLQPDAEPFAVNIEQSTANNGNYREVSWTGEHMQLVLMSLAPGEEIPREMHEDLDQFIRIEQGQAQVLMGKSRDELSFDQNVEDDWAVLIPAGYYHNVKNTGQDSLKLYTLYAPAAHPEGAVHKTFEEAEAYEEQKGH